MRANQRLQNLLVSKDFTTFKLLEPPVGAFESGAPPTPTGTDLDEYNQYMKQSGGQGLGEVIFNDPDDARDLAEFSDLTGTDQQIAD